MGPSHLALTAMASRYQPKRSLDPDRPLRRSFVFGRGPREVQVMTSALDEANTSSKGWALLHDVEFASVPADRVLFEVETPSGTRRPVAVGGHRRRGFGRKLMLEVVAASGPREDKLYRAAELIDAHEIARMLRVTPAALWKRRQRDREPVKALESGAFVRRDGPPFPEPVLRGGFWWDRRDVMDWAHACGRTIRNPLAGTDRNGRVKAVEDRRRLPTAWRRSHA
jgi:hypothetical protein